jgi:uncharacterized protein with FMN-binding domain
VRRAPIVAGATIAGLAAVLSFHTRSVPLTLGTPSSLVPGPSSSDPSTSVRTSLAPAIGHSPATAGAPSTSTSAARPTTNATTSGPAISKPPAGATTTADLATTSAPPSSTPTTGAPATTGPPPTVVPATTVPPTTVAPATRTATGAAVNYNYGVISVSATISGAKLTDVAIASIDDGGNFRSVSIDQQAVPVLEQEALQAQGANIQGVSGASYTSEGFEQSLQSALGQLGFR